MVNDVNNLPGLHKAVGRLRTIDEILTEMYPTKFKALKNIFKFLFLYMLEIE